MWSCADASQAKTRFGHRNGCLLCMFHVDHNSVSKPTPHDHAHDVDVAKIELQKVEEGLLEPQHTPQEVEVEIPTKAQHNAEPQDPEVEIPTTAQDNAEPPQEANLPDSEDSAKNETPSVQDPAGDESPEDPPVVDSQPPIESPQPEPSVEDDASKAQIEDAKSQDDKAVDDEAKNETPSVKDAAGDESPEDPPVVDSQPPIESPQPEPSVEDNASKAQVEDVISQDGQVVDDETKKSEDTPAPKSQLHAALDSPSQPAENDATPEPVDQAVSKNDKIIDDKSHAVRKVPSIATLAKALIKTEERKDQTNALERSMSILAKVNMESFIPEEEGTGLGHVFPFANSNYDPRPLKNLHGSKTYAMEQKGVETPEPPADAPVKTEKRGERKNTLDRNMSILATVNQQKVEEANAVALESFVPEEEGTGLTHVFPFANPNYDPETPENLHDAETSAKEENAAGIVGVVPEASPATRSEINNEDSAKEVPAKGTEENKAEDLSKNEKSTDETAKDYEHVQNAPEDGGKNDMVEEVIPSSHEDEQTPVEALRTENQGSKKKHDASEAQAPAENKDVEDAQTESATKPDTNTAPGQTNPKVEAASDSKSNLPNGKALKAPVTKPIAGGSRLRVALPFRTRPTMKGTTAAKVTTEHPHPKKGNAQHDENDSKNTSPSQTLQVANVLQGPVDHDPKLEKNGSDSSEDKQDQQSSPSEKSEDTQASTEEFQESSSIQQPGAIEEIPLSGSKEPDITKEVAAPQSSSGGSAYESLSGDDDTNGEDNLISQAVSNLRHETLNNRLIDRLVEDPVRVGEIMAASAQTKEEEEPREIENSSGVPEDLALSDEDSIPELKLPEPIDEEETGNEPPLANEGETKKSTTDDYSKHDMLHDRMASSLAKDPIGVSKLISAKSGEVGGFTVDLQAPSFQEAPNATVPPTLEENEQVAETKSPKLSSSTTLIEAKDAFNPEDGVQVHLESATTVALETGDGSKGKMSEINSPLPETEASTELDTTAPTAPTPTRSQLRRAQAKRARQRKAAEREAAERAAAASQEGGDATAASTVPDGSENKQSGKPSMTKSQAKRAKKLRAKQRKLEAGKKSM